MAENTFTSLVEQDTSATRALSPGNEPLNIQAPNNDSQTPSPKLTPNISQHPIESTDTLGTLNPSTLTAQAKIPSLMSIQTNVTTPESLPNPQTENSDSVLEMDVDLQDSLAISTEPDLETPLPGTVNSTPLAPVSTPGYSGHPRVSQGKVMDNSTVLSPYTIHSQDSNDSDESGIQKKVPILRLKKKFTSDDLDASFERQEISKNDSYCWVCHDGGDVLCCDKCPRVFHIQCSGLPKAPEGDEEWFCPVCKNIARKTKRSRPSNLKELLLLAVGRMMFPSTEIFQAPVPPDIMIHYREYIFHPLDLGSIRKKVASGEYHSTREFTHDVEWILHNCIIYNGAKHALTKIAKGIIKVCKEDMREIELCPGCYKLTVRQPKDWFCVPCNPPHPVVLAKVRGYPLWPAKLISETSDKCDVRFFGQHDRSLVPKSSISELNGLPPKPSSKTQHWNEAMFELKKYKENIEKMLSQQSGGKLPVKPIKFTKQRDSKTPSLEQNHQNNSGSNHLPASPAVVEVSPGSGLGNSNSEVSHNYSEPSSPDSPQLQIDLEDSSQPAKQYNSQSNKGLGILSAIERNSQMSGLDTGSQAVTNTSGLSSPTSRLGTIKRVNKGRKIGDTLSQVVSNLFERQQMVTPSSSAPVMVTTAGVSTPLDNLEPEQPGKEDPEEPMATASPVVDVYSFSTVYADRNKTAIYEVDPSGKRERKKRKPPNDSTATPPAAKKPARPKVSPSKSAPISMESLTESPQIHVASAELVKLAKSTKERVPSSMSPQPQALNNGQLLSTNHFPGAIPTPKTPQKSSKPPSVANKKVKRPKASKTAKSSSKTSVSASQHAVAPSVITNVQMATATIPQPPLTAASDRLSGEQAAPGVNDESSEGNGLLAGTIRKFDSSFNARLNQMVGGSKDMGYQYFMEKLMSSVKTVLIEMLSQFDAKSRLSAKQLKDQLHTCWPVPNSRVALDQLRNELREEMKQCLDVVKASSALELQQVINEVKRQVEKEKEIAITETKKKKWCSYCLNEAQYNCCWNANYCNEACQQAHWQEHMKECTQIQQAQPKTPGLPPNEVPSSGHSSKPSTPQLPPTAPGQEGGYMFASTMAAVHAQRQPVLGGINTPSHSQQAHPGSVQSSSGHVQQHHNHTSSGHVEGMVTPHTIEHNAQPESSRMEHHPSENILITTAAASPPNHIRSLFLNQNQQQRKSPAMSSAVNLATTQGNHLHHGMSSTPIAENVSMATVAHPHSEHAHSSNSSSGLLHAQSPISPAISHSAESQPTVHHNYSWPYHPQQQLIIGNEGYHHTLPILPMQVNTSSSQNQGFSFRPTY